MTLDRIILTNFKNYREADIDLCGNVNCFVGNNGAGKTNLLDAVYYLSFCKSYFNPVDTQNIMLGESYFAIHGHYGDQQASCVLKRGQPKQMRWNKKTCKTLMEHIGRIPLVIVSPSDQTLITGGSESRRKFIDGIISQTDKQYLDHLVQYTRALEQRNRLLKQMWEDRLFDEATVSVWDGQLSRHGEYLYQSRERFIADFTPLFQQYYHTIAGSQEPGVIRYQRDTRPLDQQLADSRQADKYSQYTTCGPHKDDLQMLLENADSEAVDFTLKRFGSQGQQKSFALALKLAQFQYIEECLGQKPILLLDDIFDKLDMLRVKQLIALVGSDRFGQVLLTDTQPGRVQAIFDELPNLQHRIFQVEKGKVYELGR
jgi:DNA replication and repair protein RecF